MLRAESFDLAEAGFDLDFKGFDLDDKTILRDEHQKKMGGVLSREYRLQQKYIKIITQKSKSLNIDFDSLAEGYQTRIITNNAVNAIVVLSLISERYEMDEVYICVYRMNQKAVNWIRDELAFASVKTLVLLSSFTKGYVKAEKWFEAVKSLESDRFVVKTGCLHAKIFCCQTKCGKFFIFEGSGNLSDNSKLEQYIIEQNEDVFNFHKNWMLDYEG